MSSTSDEESPAVIKPTKAVLRGDIDGLGKFLFQMHSVHYVPILFAKEEVTLQFYEHVVVAMITTQLWCFPKTTKTFVIPRYKIIDASFTYGPKSIPWPAWFLLFLGLLLVIIGLSLGGCREQSSYSYYSYSSYTYKNTGACASSVFGFLILLIPLPLLLFVPCCFKKHHVCFEVKGTPWPKQRVRSIYYDFRFKQVGFDNAASNNAVFDEYYLINYVFGTLGKHGLKTMEDYHLLSHFNHVNLTDPIKPVHADDSILDVISTAAPAFVRTPKVAPVSPFHSTAGESAYHSSTSHHHKRQQKSIDV